MAESNQSKLTSWLLSMLTVGFLAWAGVVWSASDRLTDSLNVMMLRLASIETTLQHISDELHEHEQLPWHGDVGLELDRLKREMSRRDSNGR